MLNDLTLKFIEKAIKVHGTKYTYDKVLYINSKKKVCITCPIHGDFWQTPNVHLKGSGCRKCGYAVNPNLITLELFFEKLKTKEIYNKYDFSKVHYVNNHTKVTVICPIHGEFEIVPANLLRNYGCAKCGRERGRLSRIKTQELFIKDCIDVHGNKYDYSKVNYKGKEKKIEIICKKHGSFFQTADSHLYAKSGCPKCNSSKLEILIDKLLSDNNIKFETLKKFKWLGLQSLDFYLPDYNIGIECQGIQHFRPIKHFGGDSEFNIVKERDKIKLQKCLEHNINLIYYSNINYEFPYKVITNELDLLTLINLPK